jgi:SEC-C motif
MSKVGRNEPCSCGSGLKAKRCCLAPDDAKVTTPRATLARLQGAVVTALVGKDRAAFHELYGEMIDLPELDVSLHVRLPGLITPEVEAAMSALADGADDRFDEALAAAMTTVNTVERRLELAEAVLALRDRGLVQPDLAAVSIIDLNRDDSALLLSSLAQAIAVRCGTEATPSGLLLAG